jgi:hypothetical protein
MHGGGQNRDVENDLRSVEANEEELRFPRSMTVDDQVRIIGGRARRDARRRARCTRWARRARRARVKTASNPRG